MKKRAVLLGIALMLMLCGCGSFREAGWDRAPEEAGRVVIRVGGSDGRGRDGPPATVIEVYAEENPSSGRTRLVLAIDLED